MHSASVVRCSSESLLSGYAHINIEQYWSNSKNKIMPIINLEKLFSSPFISVKKFCHAAEDIVSDVFYGSGFVGKKILVLNAMAD